MFLLMRFLLSCFA